MAINLFRISLKDICLKLSPCLFTYARAYEKGSPTISVDGFKERIAGNTCDRRHKYSLAEENFEVSIFYID